MNIKNIKKEIKKYNGTIDFKNDKVYIYGEINKNKIPKSILGYDFIDELVCYMEGKNVKWDLLISTDKLLRKEKQLTDKHQAKKQKQKKKFEVKRIEKRERKIQQNLNEFIKEYNT